MPQQVAVDLVGLPEVTRLNNRQSYGGVNPAPKSLFASAADITGLYQLRGLPVPAWINTFVWPPAPPAPPALPAVLGNVPFQPPPPAPAPAAPNQAANMAPNLPGSSRPGPTNQGDFDDSDFDEDEEMVDVEEDDDEDEDDDEEDDDEDEDDDDEEDDDDDAMSVDSNSKALSAINPSPGMIIDHQDPCAKRGETIYVCHVHKQDPQGPRFPVAGNMRSMYNHYNQWHPDTLRAAFAGQYDALYTEEMATRGQPAVPGSNCYLCNETFAGFEEVDEHFRVEHEDERWSIAEGIFDKWTNLEGIEGPLVVISIRDVEEGEDESPVVAPGQQSASSQAAPVEEDDEDDDEDMESEESEVSEEE